MNLISIVRPKDAIVECVRHVEDVTRVVTNTDTISIACIVFVHTAFTKLDNYSNQKISRPPLGF